MKTWFSTGLLFVLAYAVFLVSSVPAKLVVAKISLPSQLRLVDISGTIWRAHIGKLVSGTNEVNNINASLSLSSLFKLAPSIDVTFGGGLADGPEGSASISGLRSGLTIKQAKITMPAQDIAQQLVLPIALNAKGMVRLNVPSFVLGRPMCEQLTGQLEWQNAAVVAAEQSIVLGKLSAKLSCAQGAIVAVVDKGNILGLTFTAYLRNINQLSGNGYLTPGRQFPELLTSLLPLLGNPDRQGRYRLLLP